MRLFLAKILISSLLLYQVYLLTYRQVSKQAILKVLALNIDAFDFHSKNTEFLKKYLHLIIVFCFSVSLLTLISKNLFPKFIVVFGISLWMTFGFHPLLQTRNMIIQRCQYLAIIGALLYIGGCEYFEKDFSFVDLAHAQAAQAEEKQEQPQKQQ